MFIPHGTYHLPSERFIFWGEDTVAHPPKRGRQAKSPTHPYAAPVEQLADWLNHLFPGLVTEEKKERIWLPSSDQQPQPSPELQSAGVAAEATDALTLTAWQIPVLVLTPLQTLDVLLALPPHLLLGRDIRFWRLVAREAVALVASQQVWPTLKREGFQLTAHWQPLPEQAERTAQLSAHMPPLCRALTQELETAPAPSQLVTQFIQHAVDGLVRESAENVKPTGRAPGVAWLIALTGSSQKVQLSADAADDLFKAWQSWAGQNDATGNQAFRIAFRLTTPDEEHQSDEWALEYLLQATDDPSLIVSAGQIWRGHKDPYLLQRFDQPQERLLRGLAFAGRLFPPILESLRRKAPEHAQFETEQAYTFLKEVAPLLQASGFRVLLPREWSGQQARITTTRKVSTKSNTPSRLSLETLLRYDVEIMLGDQTLDRKELQRLATLKQPLVQIRGQWVLLDQAQLEAALKLLEQGRPELPLEDVLRMGLEEASPDSIETDGWLKTLLDLLRHPEQIEQPPIPRGLKAELRPYQQRGFAWLAFLQRYGLGACLADDMGLGKTLQTIAFILHFRAAHESSAPVLVICPTSVVGNWRREIQRFAPDLRVQTHQGADRDLGEAFTSHIKEAGVVLTSYPLLARDRDTLTEVDWSLVVLDEAQNIKNSSTKQAQAARALRSEGRIALTGTPVENRLSELWSIFQFINPQYLNSEAHFRRRFAIPIEKFEDADAAKRLKHLTTPFILRRLKTDPKVISDLPEKQEMKVYINLTSEQVTLYEAVVKNIMARIDEAENACDNLSRRGLVLSLLMQLKQVCNHPAQYLKDGSAIDGRSGKVARLTEMLEEIYATGDRALIFTQFAEMGEILREHCRRTFYDEPLWLYGGTKVKEREEMIHRFQSENGPTVFLLSLKAGGVGLNLTRANHVFHFDRWWNPAVENQATDRAFRIGQTRNVQVHKFICAGTLEEKIDAMIESKKALAERVVGNDEAWLTELSTTALKELVQLREAEA